MLNYAVITRNYAYIFVLTATYEFRVSRKIHLCDHPTQYPQWSLPSSPWSWPGIASLTPSVRRIREFNVSNLMGLKRRIIDIGKSTAFNFLQNVLKCTIFSRLHLKFQKVILFMTQKFFCVKNINTGIKNAEFYADFKFVDVYLNKCP
jgi:hypothetical protein